MFDPIISLTVDQYHFMCFVLFSAINLLGYAWTLGHAAVRWVDDKKAFAITPLIYLLDLKDPEYTRTPDNTGDRCIELTFGTLGQLILTGIVCWAVTGIINWAWLPVSFVAGIVITLRTLRGVVRIRKKLDAHVKDKNAHQS